MKSTRTDALLLAGAGLLLWVGCASSQAAEGPRAKATIESKSGSTVTGTATFTELTTGGVRVHIHIEHATPGSHGLHIHDKGDCSDPKAENAGGHFNPGAMPHAGPMEM